MIEYLTTIHRRCLFCLVENSGALICFDGRSQTGEQWSVMVDLHALARLTEHHGMDAVEPWDKQRDSQDDQQDVSQQEVRTPK